MTSWEDRVRLLQTESQRFQQYLQGLPDEAWSKQSACDLWQVQDVVAHLIGNAEFYAGTVERGLRGVSSPAVCRRTRAGLCYCWRLGLTFRILTTCPRT